MNDKNDKVVAKQVLEVYIFDDGWKVQPHELNADGLAVT